MRKSHRHLRGGKDVPLYSVGEDSGEIMRYLGTSAEFWLGLQSDYELEKAKDELAAKIAREVHPRKRAA